MWFEEGKDNIMIKLIIDDNMAEMVDLVGDETLGGAFRAFVENMTSDDAEFPTGNEAVNVLAKYLLKYSEVTTDGE